ncbi:hypothetical protein FGG08_004540 [Glutinoglossum americanum]|uniref:PNPLA domain-containing protein n=1 Tax=Glutinoglossum americanum TaxID=1670608 RepID=A0A9P8I8Z9_9PEZI|nr:hypothetical protein FGG08_004540 [Glutinoglossum americanum]
MTSPVPNPMVCVKCGKAANYHCHPCDDPYCSSCQVDHCDRHANRGIPYEIYQQVEAVLATEQDESLRRQMHDCDSLARWIGITMPDNIGNAQPSLWGYSRIADLLTGNHVPEIQYPSLVSFIGGTGTGKSTLIRSLIRFSCQNTPTPGMEPIISDPKTPHRSTSSDVHLYSDPGTEHEERPLLLADSEGLRGGPPEAWPRWLGKDEVGGAVVTTINNKRTITWAQNEKADRMYIVEHLYPRFLYTFSDLICFVASTAREIERDTVDLLEWASLGYEKTLNQRTPPALLVVINNAVGLEDRSWYDVNEATRKWLTRLDESVDPARNITFSKYEELKNKWSRQGTEISKPSQLLLHYYSDFKVVCIPSSSAKLQTHGDIYLQYQKLHDEIRTLALLTAKKKEEANLILDTTTFQMYVQQALNHFAEEHGKPFDLEEVSGNMRPVPNKFKNHVVNVLLHMRDKIGIDKERVLLERMAPLVAATVAFSASQSGKDTGLQPTHFDRVFARCCVEACDKFYQEHWRCEQSLNNKRCKNVKGGHTKGHQYVHNPKEGSGIWICSGEFTASYDPSLFTKLVVEHLRSLTIYNTEIHRQTLQQALIKDWWPWVSFVKPPSAGVRVLTLDGGGVRGILELIVLRYLQDYVAVELGAYVPVIDMFDLVVGTSTGGIIALGLAHCLWDIPGSIVKFTHLASKIFTPRPPGTQRLYRYLIGHKYRTSVVENAYRNLFPKDGPLVSSQRASPIKVAVTAVSDISGSYRPYLITNYSRPFVHSKEWLVRPDTYEQEVKVWEAARATSAAPTFFKPYTHDATGVVYKDGALKCNNPIRIADSERRSIWRSGSNSLDLHLSIGTGVNPELGGAVQSYDRRSRTGIGVLIDIATDAVKSTMDSESEYESFRRDLHDEEIRKRYHRFNVCINDGQPTPSFDDCRHIQRLKDLAKKHCESKDIEPQLRQLARILVSSTFYYEKKSWHRLPRHWVCQGAIHSRLTAERQKALSALVTKGVSFMVGTESPPNAGGEPKFETATTVSASVTPWPMPLEFAVSEASKDRRICIDLIFPDGLHCAISGFPRTIA